jgi:cation diffusion facilitator family transporter
VYAALVGNLLIALTKTAAALWSGSSAMLSEAIHSFVDTGNEVLLLYGLHRAGRQPDTAHPLGYGRELYFWSFIVALLIFALGAGVSTYEGIVHIHNPEPIHDPLVNYIVLALSFIFEGASWWVALKRFNVAKGELGYYEAFRRSKDPPSFMVLFEDTAALVGILIAAAGNIASVSLSEPVFDGIASIAIGAVLGATAILLARESKSLLIGEQASTELTRSILEAAAGEPSVSRPNGVMTVQLAPDQIVAALSLEFTDKLRAPEIENAVVAIEQRVRAAHPEVVALFVKPQTDETFRKRRQERFGVSPTS